MLEFLFVEIRWLVQYAVLLALAAWAWRQGEAPERHTAAVFLGAVVLEMLHPLLVPHNGSTHVSLAHTGLDMAMLVAFAFIAMRANRIYPIWILGAQLIATVMHFERGVIANLEPMAYWALIRIPFYLQMLAFASGMFALRRRRRRGIVARPWRRSSPR